MSSKTDIRSNNGADSADSAVNPALGLVPTIGDVIDARYSRRAALGIMAGAAASSLLSSHGLAGGSDWIEPPRGVNETLHIAGGFESDVLIRWGDPLNSGIGPFDPHRQSADDQESRFGYNCDFIGFVPLEEGPGGDACALLCVNHEYTIADLMFPDKAGRELTAEECEIEKAAHGGSIVEIRKSAGRWSYVSDSPFNRRITTRSTEIELTGPAAGSPRLATSADPEGRVVVGTLNNCAGGITPWGTYLMAEENFDDYFMGEASGAEARNYNRYGVPEGKYAWGHFDRRFHLAHEPNEPNRFGWMVEVDPRDPSSQPRKRTALGRFKHEGGETVLSRSGHAVVYMGDDQRFDYLYKFVTEGRFDPQDPDANADLLASGTLYVARFEADGTVHWMPLVFGEGPLTPDNGFDSQADVLIEARRAADLLGATPMDRPEDVQPDARTGRVYVMLTNNSERQADDLNAANPRGPNLFGHIVEITEPNGDFDSERSRWEILVRCGPPGDPEVGAKWGPGTTESGWFGSPDNCELDNSGRLYVASDGPEVLNQCANGIWRVETEGPARGQSRLLLRAPTGAEVCGPRFTGDQRNLFASVQHPGSDGEYYPGHGRPSTFSDPSTRWPDFNENTPPRPSVVSVWRKDGRAFPEV